MAYDSTPFSELSSAVYYFAPSHADVNARTFLDARESKLACEDYNGYKAGFKQEIIEIGCTVHARRKFFDLHTSNKSQIAEHALLEIDRLYEVERQAKELNNVDR